MDSSLHSMSANLFPIGCSVVKFGAFINIVMETFIVRSTSPRVGNPDILIYKSTTEGLMMEAAPATKPIRSPSTPFLLAA